MRPITPEQVDGIVLSLVNTGAVTKHHQTYFKSGHPLPAWLLPDLLFDALVADGLLALTPPNDKGLARVSRHRPGALCPAVPYASGGTPCLSPVLTDRSISSPCRARQEKWLGLTRLAVGLG